MLINYTDNINAMDEVAVYCAIYQFSKQFITSKLGKVRLYGKSGPPVQ